VDNLRQVLRQPDFFRLWFGQIISSIGDRFYQCALFTVVLGLNQGTQIGKESARVIFVGMLPALLFAPLLGWIVDRFDRKRILIFADLSRVLLVAALIAVWFHTHDLALVYLLVFFIGAMNCLFIPARQAALPQLVGEGDLISANALISLVGVIASLFGVLLAGGVAAIFGARAGFYVTVGGFAVSAWFIFRITRPLRPEPKVREENAHPLAKTWREISAGWNYVKEDRSTQWVIVMSALFSFVTGFFMISVMEFAVRQLDLSALRDTVGAAASFLARFAPKPPVINIPLTAVGLFMGALGLGLGVGSLTCGSARRWTRRKGLPFAAFLLIGTVLLLFARVPGYFGALLFSVVLGWGSALFAVPIEARLQTEVPNACRGRVFALRNFCTSVAFMGALALHLSGYLLRVLGPSLLIEALGGAMIGMGLVLGALNRRDLAACWGQDRASDAG
jgi:DHA3 family macrolide efflux protein-like MFS transporter